MKALVKNNQITNVQDVKTPTIDAVHNVLIQVKLSGICRTDINVSKGLMPSTDGVILGHEFYGEIADTRATVSRFELGQKVTVDPSIFGSGRNLMCGIDVDGAFAEFIKVPEHSVYVLPEELSPEASAFIEPIAASLAVLKADLKKEERGCIYGDNRIAKLTHKIMHARGFENVVIHSEKNDLEENAYDYIIETIAKTDDLRKMLDGVKVGGKIVLKSRQIRPVELIFNTLVRKEISMRAVNYGNFNEAIVLLTGGQLELDDLFGETYPLENFEQAFFDSQKDEARKCYLKV